MLTLVYFYIGKYIKYQGLHFREACLSARDLQNIYSGIYIRNISGYWFYVKRNKKPSRSSMFEDFLDQKVSPASYFSDACQTKNKRARCISMHNVAFCQGGQSLPLQIFYELDRITWKSISKSYHRLNCNPAKFLSKRWWQITLNERTGTAQYNLCMHSVAQSCPTH